MLYANRCVVHDYAFKRYVYMGVCVGAYSDNNECVPVDLLSSVYGQHVAYYSHRMVEYIVSRWVTESSLPLLPTVVQSSISWSKCQMSLQRTQPRYAPFNF